VGACTQNNPHDRQRSAQKKNNRTPSGRGAADAVLSRRRELRRGLCARDTGCRYPPRRAIVGRANGRAVGEKGRGLPNGDLPHLWRKGPAAWETKRRPPPPVGGSGTAEGLTRSLLQAKTHSSAAKDAHVFGAHGGLPRLRSTLHTEKRDQKGLQPCFTNRKCFNPVWQKVAASTRQGRGLGPLVEKMDRSRRGQEGRRPTDPR